MWKHIVGYLDTTPVELVLHRKRDGLIIVGRFYSRGYLYLAGLVGFLVGFICGSTMIVLMAR